MPEVVNSKHTDTIVGEAIEALKDRATNDALQKHTGLAATTVSRSAKRLGYSLDGYGGVWTLPHKRFVPVPTGPDLGEVVEALMLIADRMEQKTPTVEAKQPAKNELLVPVVRFDASDLTAMRQAGPTQPLEHRIRMVSVYASYVLADQVQN